MKLNSIGAAILPVLGFALAGCASINLNEGSASYSNLSTTAQPHQIYYSLDEQKKDDVQAALISKNDNISVTISAIYICDFRESGLLTGDFFDTSNANSAACPVEENKRLEAAGNGSASKQQQTTTRGELAILGNIKESESFVGVDRKDQRVFFYSDDVRETGQLLNFSNKTIYGPVKYNGGYLDIAFSIMELDEEENKNLKAVLNSLASLGAKAYPPSSAALETINEVGKTILDSNKDDVTLSYTTRFDPPNVGDISKIERAPLQEGFYAVLRNENRNTEPGWEEVCLNRKLGMLVHCIDNKPSTKVYREKTWMVFRISRESNAVSAANNKFETLEKFRKTQEISNDTPLSKAADILKQKLEKIEEQALDETAQADKSKAAPIKTVNIQPLS